MNLASFRTILGCSALLLVNCGGEIDRSTVDRSGAAPGTTAPPAPPAPPASPPASPSDPAGPSDRCATPQRLVLVDGAVTMSDETTTASNEFASLECESPGTAGPLDGPQRYYVLAVRAGRTYSFALKPTFHAVLLGFEVVTSCAKDAIERACRGDGGFASPLINPGTGTSGATVFGTPPPFKAERDLDLVVVVDSDGASGTFDLTITETD